MQYISVRGARTHNLKNIDVELPRNKLIVITGLSGSGKSSLAFDTLYAEGQRRYVESLSSYARQFLSMMDKPEVDHIEGLSPAISIEQKSTSHNPRSTVGTVTEIYDYLRLLFARTGQPQCPNHGTKLEAQTISQMVDQILTLAEDTRIMLLAPVVQDRKGEHIKQMQYLQSQGFVRARIDGEILELDELPKLDLRRKHTIEAVVDRLSVHSDIKTRLADSFETALGLSQGVVTVGIFKNDKIAHELSFSTKFGCPQCGYSLAELEPRLFSFNNPAGACPTCDGLGARQFMDPERVIFDPSLSIAEGAIRPWDRHSSYYNSLLDSLSQHLKFSLDTPFQALSARVQNTLLFGSNGKDFPFRYYYDDGTVVKKSHPFEGIIPSLERRFRETESQHIRDDLAKYSAQQACAECQGTRLKESARHVFVADKNLAEITNWPIEETLLFFQNLKIPGWRGEVADKILKEIRARLEFLINVGLDYLTLDRSADTLSGGEAQRIRLASQIGAGLVGVMYVLDEPSIGLHQRDNTRLIKTLYHLRDLGNTVIVVEHDEDAIMCADHVLDIGPGAGVHGGTIVAQGTPKQVQQNKHSLTGQYLSGKQQIEVPERRAIDPKRTLKLIGARGNNLKNVSAEFPIGIVTCVTGVSGSGKSTLVNDTLYPLAARKLNKAQALAPSPFQKVLGLEQFDKVVDIDQSPIGRTPRSNAATYTGIFTDIRDIFSQTPEARTRGYKPGRFSFNVKGGRCEACQGDGLIKVEMHFLPDVYVNCDICHGKRYNRETLEVLYKGKNIHEVLEMTIEEGQVFFSAIPAIARKLTTLVDVGLAYVKMGQSATTLSGGEAQRIKLAKELSKRDTGQTLYILDEPTTGLHFHDIKQLLAVLQRLCERGNTIIIIEHNLDVIKTADWIIDLGPEGGTKGGEIIACGTPEEIAQNPSSFTGQFLKPLLLKHKSQKASLKKA